MNARVRLWAGLLVLVLLALAEVWMVWYWCRDFVQGIAQDSFVDMANPDMFAAR